MRPFFFLFFFKCFVFSLLLQKCTAEATPDSDVCEGRLRRGHGLEARLIRLLGVPNLFQAAVSGMPMKERRRQQEGVGPVVVP